MKIQVGKTYKDGFGRDVYIEHQLSRGAGVLVPAGTFMGIHETGGFDWYKENGNSLLDYGGQGERDLLPNKVKKEGYIVINTETKYNGKQFTTHCFPTAKKAEAIAKLDGWQNFVVVKVEWEEEE